MQEVVVAHLLLQAKASWLYMPIQRLRCGSICRSGVTLSAEASCMLHLPLQDEVMIEVSMLNSKMV